VPPLLHGTRDFEAFRRSLSQVCLTLAKMVAQDGEGATKLAEIRIQQARSEAEARRAAEAVANSPLVKTTLFGEDINWGRIMAALGRSGARFDPERVDIFVDELPVVRRGVSAGPRAEAAANRRLRRREVALLVSLHAGRAAARLWTTDLSDAYVRINAGYRT
jgi:glutamate N-acetyltransferase / amino-acid N-acetyltransferase